MNTINDSKLLLLLLQYTSNITSYSKSISEFNSKSMLLSAPMAQANSKLLYYSISKFILTY